MAAPASPALMLQPRGCRIVLLALVVLLTPRAGQAQPTASEGVSLLRALESSVLDLIQRSERSVVSIFHVEAPPERLAGLPDPRQRQVINNRAGQPRIFIQGRPAVAPGFEAFRPLATAPPLASGAGVVIDKSGLVLTQYRVVKLGDTHIVTDVEGERYVATIRAADPRSGLAVLAIERRLIPPDGDTEGEPPIDLPALEIGEAETLRKGRFVVAIGNPFSIESDGQPTASWGTITNTALKAPTNENLNDAKFIDGSYRTTLHHFGSLIQTDARLGWNASGGALVDLDGRLIGIVTTASAIAGHEQPAGYAIPLNDAMRRAVAAMRAGREPEYGLLGVNFQPGSAVMNPKTGRRGVRVGGVFRGGPAQMAGLNAGDLLLSIDGESLPTTDALQLAVGGLAPGEQYPVRFERAGRIESTTVKLGKAYIDQGQIVTRRHRAWRGLRVDFATAIPPQILSQRASDGHLDEEGCVVVSEVEEGSVSWKSGVRPYSYISHVGGKRVTTPQEFYDAVKDAGDNVKLKFTKPLQPGAGTLN